MAWDLWGLEAVRNNDPVDSIHELYVACAEREITPDFKLRGYADVLSMTRAIKAVDECVKKRLSDFIIPQEAQEDIYDSGEFPFWSLESFYRRHELVPYPTHGSLSQIISAEWAWEMMLMLDVMRVLPGGRITIPEFTISARNEEETLSVLLSNLKTCPVTKYEFREEKSNLYLSKSSSSYYGTLYIPGVKNSETKKFSTIWYGKRDETMFDFSGKIPEPGKFFKLSEYPEGPGDMLALERAMLRFPPGWDGAKSVYYNLIVEPVIKLNLIKQNQGE